MLDISSINAVSGILADIGVLVGVAFAVLQLRDLVKTRQTDLIMRLYSTFGSREFQETWLESYFWVKDFEDFEEHILKKGDYKKWASIYIFSYFFEGIGVLLNNGLIDTKLVFDLFKTPIRTSWSAAKPIIEGLRKRSNDPEYLAWFEYLYNEMRKREQQLAKIQ
jgi:hypothetical protein